MAALRRCLVTRGEDPQTPGVVGAPRHFALKQRLLARVASEAADAEDAWAADRAAFLGHPRPNRSSGRSSSSSSSNSNGAAAAGAAGRQWQGDGKRQLEAFVVNPVLPPPPPQARSAPTWLATVALPGGKIQVAARALDSDSD
jgi:hypothetical protein